MVVGPGAASHDLMTVSCAFATGDFLVNEEVHLQYSDLIAHLHHRRFLHQGVGDLPIDCDTSDSPASTPPSIDEACLPLLDYRPGLQEASAHPASFGHLWAPSKSWRDLGH